MKKNHIILNQNLTDPAKIISGDINSEAIQWIRANSHRYLGKYTGEGQMTICQLSDDNNGGKTDAVYFADTNYTYIDNPENDGRCDWFMRLPKFYYHAEEVEPDIWDIGFGQDPEEDDWKCWDGNDLIGCFKGFVNDGRLLSKKSVTPTVSMSQSDFKQCVLRRGTGYSLVKWKHHSMMAFLFYAMYGNTNSQDTCGFGSTTLRKTTGSMDTLGMTDTVAGVNDDTGYINFWGLENWWVDVKEFIDNIYGSNLPSEGIYDWSIYEDDGSVRKIRGTSNGIITKIHIGEYLDTAPLELIQGGIYNYGFCDIFTFGGGIGDLCFCRLYDSGRLDSGIASLCWYTYDSIHKTIGSRLAFRGDIIVENDVPTFRSIPISNDGYGDSPVSP